MLFDFYSGCLNLIFYFIGSIAFISFGRFAYQACNMFNLIATNTLNDIPAVYIKYTYIGFKIFNIWFFISINAFTTADLSVQLYVSHQTNINNYALSESIEKTRLEKCVSDVC